MIFSSCLYVILIFDLLACLCSTASLAAELGHVSRMQETGPKLSDRSVAKASLGELETNNPPLNSFRFINSSAQGLDNGLERSSQNSVISKQKYLDISTSWQNNRDQLELLYQDARELSALEAELCQLCYRKLYDERLFGAELHRIGISFMQLTQLELSVSELRQLALYGGGSHQLDLSGLSTGDLKRQGLSAWESNQLRLFVQGLHRQGQKIKSDRRIWPEEACLILRIHAETMEILKLIREKVKFCTQSRLLELGGIPLPNFNSDLIMASINRHPKSQSSSEKTDMPHDLCNLILQKVFKDDWQIAFEGMYQGVLRHISHFGMEQFTDFETKWWKYILKSMYFFSKNDLLSQHTLERYLHDSMVSSQLYLYFEELVQSNAGKYIHFGSHSLAEHWFWALEHEELQVVDKKLKARINALFLMEHRRIEIWTKIQDNLEHGQHAVWNKFCSRLLEVNFDVDWVDKPKFDSMDLVDEVENMIAIVAWEENRFLNQEDLDLRIIMSYICDLLELVETYKPGVIKEKLKNNHHAEEFDNRYQLLHLHAKIDGIKKKQDHLLTYIGDQIAHDSSEQSKLELISNHPQYGKFRSTSDHQLTEFKSLLKRLEQERLRVYKRKGILTHSEFHNLVQRNVNIFKKEAEMSEKSAELLLGT